MHFSASLLVSFLLALAADVLADANPQTPKLGLIRRAEKISKRNIPSLLDTRETCRGTCKTCFGAGYTDCPNSDYYCWDPSLGSADLQCSGSLAGSPSTSASAPSPSITGTETCVQKGASCVACFGIGSTECPSGSYYDCYEPAKLSEAQGCNKPGSDGGASSDSSPLSTPIASRSTSADGIVNTATSFSLAAGSSLETSTVPRITRTTSATSSRVDSSPAASTESGLGITDAAPALLGKDIGVAAAVAAGLVVVMGLL